jgi:hypothetical protein
MVAGSIYQGQALSRECVFIKHKALTCRLYAEMKELQSNDREFGMGQVTRREYLEQASLA